MTAQDHIKLGLIGDNIKPSRSPDLHRLAGRLCGLNVTYQLLIPTEMGKDFDTVLDECAAHGYRGVNITYPYKEQVVARVEVADPLVRRVGSVNTVVFASGTMRGYNTDYTGFISAFHQHFGAREPGAVAMIGAGGVGKAVAFGLLVLGATEIRIVDHDIAKAETLALSLNQASEGALRASVHAQSETAMTGADGVVNCTPVGMAGYPGTPVARHLLPGCKWAFDAVYTPTQTEFISDSEANGLRVLSGYELFIHQGVQAFQIFTGRAPDDQNALRQLLMEGAGT
jgi:quinate/shikimate dehydrogenase (NAD+)